MWDEQHQREFDALRQREQAGTLTKADRQRLDDLFAALDEDEWHTLRPAFQALDKEQQRLLTEQARLREQNTALAALAERYEALLGRARVQVEQLTQERETLRREYNCLLR